MENYELMGTIGEGSVGSNMEDETTWIDTRRCIDELLMLRRLVADPPQ